MKWIITARFTESFMWIRPIFGLWTRERKSEYNKLSELKKHYCDPTKSCSDKETQYDLVRYVRGTILIRAGDIVLRYVWEFWFEWVCKVFTMGNELNWYVNDVYINGRVKCRLVISNVPALCGDKDHEMELGCVISNKLSSRTWNKVKLMMVWKETLNSWFCLSGPSHSKYYFSL